MASLKTNNYEKAIENSNRVLEKDPNNVKALFRRAQAYAATKEFESAKRDLVAAAKIEPANSDVRKEYERYDLFAWHLEDGTMWHSRKYTDVLTFTIELRNWMMMKRKNTNKFILICLHKITYTNKVSIYTIFIIRPT